MTHLATTIGVMQEDELVELLSVEDLRVGPTRHPHTAALWALTLDLEDPGDGETGVRGGAVRGA